VTTVTYGTVSYYGVTCNIAFFFIALESQKPGVTLKIRPEIKEIRRGAA